MSPEESMTIQCPIDAKNLVEAMEKFPQSMEQMLKNMMPQARELQDRKGGLLRLPFNILFNAFS